MELKTNNIIYYVETLEDLFDLAEKLDKLGVRWSSGKSLIDKDLLIGMFHKISSFCLSLQNGKTFREDKSYYEKEHSHIPIVTYKKKLTAVEYARSVIARQEKKGQEHYNGTMETSGYDVLTCIENALEELADAMVYLSKSRNDLVNDEQAKENEDKQEKLYKVILSNGQTLIKNSFGNMYFEMKPIKNDVTSFSRNTLMECGYGWVCDCPSIQVEEAE